MKRKHVIATFALSALMGIGVFAGVRANKVKEANAAGKSTLYCKMTYDWWKADGAAIGVHYWGGDTRTDWPGVRGTKVTSDTDVWKFEVPSNSTGLSFTRISGTGNVNDYGAKTADLTIPTDGKNLYTITSSTAVWGNPGVTGEWSAYVEPTPVPAEYHLLGDFNSWKDAGNEYLLTVDAEDSNHYTIGDIEIAANQGFKVCDVPHNIWYGNQGANVSVAEAGVYDIDFYVNADNNDHIVATKQVAPQPTYNYEMTIVGEEETYALKQGEQPNEYFLEETKSIAAGKQIKFTQIDGETKTVLSVSPKEDGQLTKVYNVDEQTLALAQDYEGKLMLDINTNKVWADQFTPGYYLAGVGENWNAKLAKAAHKVAEEDPAYVVENVVLGAGEELKYINFPEEGNEISWFPVEFENEQPKVATSTEVKFTVVTEGPGSGNLKVTNAGTYDIYYNPVSHWYSIEDKNYEPDVPAEEGYYIVGDLNDWKFAGATEIPMLPEKDANNNIAILYGYSATQYKKFKVRSYFNGADDWHVNTNPAESDIGWGGDNFSPSKDELLDIFVYEEGGVTKFSVSAHAERHNVAITNLLFEGSFLRDTVERPATIATEGVAFDPGVYDVEGYHQEGYFTDEECLQKYTPTEITTDDVQLYCKYMKVGYYVISGEGYWSLDNAFLMDSPDNPNNKAEASIRVNNVGKTYSFVYYDGEMHGHAGLGDEYEFVVNEDTHIKFTKVGNYAVYWSNVDNKIYVNAGLEAFYTNFLNAVGGACHSDGIYEEGELQAVKDAWALQEAAYNSLTTEEQNTIKAIGFDPDSESQDQSVRMVKMYSYIVKKYGTAVFNDFIWSQNVEAPANYNSIGMAADDTTMTIVVISAIAVISAAGLFFLIRRKRRLVK